MPRGLALGNITSATVFQCLPLVAFGMVFTGWRRTCSRAAGHGCRLAGAVVSLIAVLHAGRWPVLFVGCWVGLYIGGIASIIAVS